MKMFHSIDEVKQGLGELSLALTIGNFDGVHLGHQALLEDLKLVAQSYDLHSLVMTFDPHPRAILQPDHPFGQRLFPIHDLQAQVGGLGIKALWVEKFTKALSELSPEQFIETYLEPLNIKFLLIGHDFRFGQNRAGGVDQLLTWAQKKSAQLKVFRPHIENNQRVSTSLIRELLLQGKVSEISEFLGRPFRIEGVIEKGKSLGSGMGFPTANINISAPILNGVYITSAELKGQFYPSVTNVGLRPTVNPNWGMFDRNIETYILDLDADLYGQNLSLHFYEYIRPEKKFDTLEDLRTQIKKDVLVSRQYFGLDI